MNAYQHDASNVLKFGPARSVRKIHFNVKIEIEFLKLFQNRQYLLIQNEEKFLEQLPHKRSENSPPTV